MKKSRPILSSLFAAGVVLTVPPPHVQAETRSQPILNSLLPHDNGNNVVNLSVAYPNEAPGRSYNQSRLGPRSMFPKQVTNALNLFSILCHMNQA